MSEGAWCLETPNCATVWTWMVSRTGMCALLSTLAYSSAESFCSFLLVTYLYACYALYRIQSTLRQCTSVSVCLFPRHSFPSVFACYPPCTPFWPQYLRVAMSFLLTFPCFALCQPTPSEALWPVFLTLFSPTCLLRSEQLSVHI